MATFQYIAKDSAGNEVRGQIEAADRNSAIMSVRAQGLLPTALGEVKSAAPAPQPESKPTRARKGGLAPAPAKKKSGLNMDIKINLKMPAFLRGKIKT